MSVKIGEILNPVYDEDVGWRPASGNVKPVHVANALVRATRGERYDTRTLNEFVVWTKRGVALDDRTPEALRESYPGVFDGLGAEMDRARRYARGLLGEAVFPSFENSSYSLTSGLMVTNDHNDRGLGGFTAALLGDVDDRESLAAAVHAATDTHRPRDPLTSLSWPLLARDAPKRVDESSARAIAALKKRHNAEFLAEITLAASCLATHERQQGNHMRTLQRALQFGCVATLAHAQALGAGGKLERRAPALMALAGARRHDVAVASERSFEVIIRNLQEWLAERLAKRLAKGEPFGEGGAAPPIHTTDLRSVRPFLGTILSPKAGKQNAEKEKRVLEERAAHYKRARQILGADGDPARVLARALVDSYCREFTSGGPKRFLQVLGCRVGLLYPHFQGRSKKKRYRPSVPVLDTLTRACVAAGETVPLSEFLERLWRRFGLVVGGRRDASWDDAAFLSKCGLRVDTPELVENSERLVEELLAMGLARRFADGVTFVGDSR